MKSIATKLVKIMSDCSYVQKDGKNSFQNYKYASAANVLEKVNEACVKYGVAAVVNTQLVSDKERTNSKGNIEILTTVQTTLTLICNETGEEITITALGSGQDVGDKGVAKAQTMALKYAWMTTLNISTGDDPEADEGVDERNQPSKLTNTQIDQAFKIAKEHGKTEVDVKAWIMKKYNKTSVADLTNLEYQALCEALKKAPVTKGVS